VAGAGVLPAHDAVVRVAIPADMPRALHFGVLRACAHRIPSFWYIAGFFVCATVPLHLPMQGKALEVP
jgi:hypothetical protein